jgi:hypothetical protein
METFNLELEMSKKNMVVENAEEINRLNAEIKNLNEKYVSKIKEFNELQVCLSLYIYYIINV